jgi:protein phosphatase
MGARTEQQDRSAVDGGVLVVADGMGGASGGGTAAPTACAAALEHMLRTLAGAGEIDPVGAAQAADEAVRRLQHEPGLEHAGSTVTIVAAHVQDDVPQLSMAWLGDTGVWVVRDGVLAQLTRPHHYAQQLVEEGRLPSSDAATHPTASRLLRGAGVGAPEVAEELSIPLQVGDRILVATDGLPAAFAPAHAGLLLAGAPDPFTAVAQILGAAVDAHAPDNVTVVVAFLDDPRLVPARAATAVLPAGPLRRRSRPPMSDGPDTLVEIVDPAAAAHR